MIWHTQPEYTLHRGDCVEEMKTMPDNSKDSVVTDSPYGIRFMGKAWDGKDIEARTKDRATYSTDPSARAGDNGGHRSKAAEAGKYDRRSKASKAFQAWTETWAREAYRILKPGGHLVNFASTRTYHRMTCGIEDAGFEIRDQLAWVFGSGFPKSLDVSKAMDRSNGEEPRQIGVVNRTGKESRTYGAYAGPSPVTEPVTDAGRKWDGWGTALKPAWEPIVLARKPMDGTVAENFAKWGVGGLNIDACRIEGIGGKKWATPRGGIWKTDADAELIYNPKGRWPANLCHDGSEEVVGMFPSEAGGGYPQTRASKKTDSIYNSGFTRFCPAGPRDMGTGSAARFFYSAKCSREDREEGLDETFIKRPLNWSSGDANPGSFQSDGTDRSSRNGHPTVKPTELMRWLARLVTPPGGTVIDPFVGSGSTGKACVLEGFQFVGIDMDSEQTYLPITKARIDYALKHRDRWEQIHAQETPAADTPGQTMMTL